MLCLSGFELYSRWVPLLDSFQSGIINDIESFQLNCKTQLMERDALNQQHVTQCYAIALIKSGRSLLVVGKTTG